MKANNYRAFERKREIPHSEYTPFDEPKRLTPIEIQQVVLNHQHEGKTYFKERNELTEQEWKKAYKVYPAQAKEIRTDTVCALLLSDFIETESILIRCEHLVVYRYYIVDFYRFYYLDFLYKAEVISKDVARLYFIDGEEVDIEAKKGAQNIVNLMNDLIFEMHIKPRAKKIHYELKHYKSKFDPEAITEEEIELSRKEFEGRVQYMEYIKRNVVTNLQPGEYILLNKYFFDISDISLNAFLKKMKGEDAKTKAEYKKLTSKNLPYVNYELYGSNRGRLIADLDRFGYDAFRFVEGDLPAFASLYGRGFESEKNREEDHHIEMEKIKNSVRFYMKRATVSNDDGILYEYSRLNDWYRDMHYMNDIRWFRYFMDTNDPYAYRSMAIYYLCGSEREESYSSSATYFDSESEKWLAMKSEVVTKETLEHEYGYWFNEKIANEYSKIKYLDNERSVYLRQLVFDYKQDLYDKLASIALSLSTIVRIGLVGKDYTIAYEKIKELIKDIYYYDIDLGITVTRVVRASKYTPRYVKELNDLYSYEYAILKDTFFYIAALILYKMSKDNIGKIVRILEKVAAVHGKKVTYYGYCAPAVFSLLADIYYDQGEYDKVTDYYVYMNSVDDRKLILKYGTMFLEGKGFAKNEKKAYEQFIKIGENDKKAAFYLAQMFDEGVYVKQNHWFAFHWYHVAGELGDRKALRICGDMLNKGGAVPMNRKKAFEYYKKAAKKGSHIAQRRMGDLYHYGILDVKDYALAKKWYEKAVKNGNKKAVKELEKLSKKGY